MREDKNYKKKEMASQEVVKNKTPLNRAAKPLVCVSDEKVSL